MSALQSDVSSPASAPVTQSIPGAGPQPQPQSPASPLGDLSTFRVITQDTANLLNAGDQSGATSRVDDLEIEWDNAEARLRAKDKAAWTEIDGKIDKVLRALRATSPDTGGEQAALTALLSALR